MDNRIHNLVPVATFLDNPLDRPVDAHEMLHLPNVFCLLDHRVVFGGKLQCLLETGVLLPRHQETQTQIGEPGGEEFAHITSLLELQEPQIAQHRLRHLWWRPGSEPCTSGIRFGKRRCMT
jgi:hypothetical protein